MNPLVKQLKERLLPEFEEIAQRVRQEIEDVKVAVKYNSYGFPDHELHFYFINCSFGAWNDEDDDVDLSVELYLQDIPRINADVCWASGRIEKEFYENWQSSRVDFPEVSDKVLEDLYKDLPRLYTALFEALKRRKPIDE